MVIHWGKCSLSGSGQQQFQLQQTLFHWLPTKRSNLVSDCTQGVPVRVEVGPRDVQQGSCVVSRRDQPGKQGKEFGVPLEPQLFISHIQGLLDNIHAQLYAEVCLSLHFTTLLVVPLPTAAMSHKQYLLQRQRLP